LGQLVDLRPIFNRQKIFITGHTGFKGSWLSMWLTEMGAEVCGYALAPESDRNLFSLLKMSDRVKDIRGDIRDLSHLKGAIEDFQPKFVFHLAAQALVLKSYESPVETFDTNVMGSVNLLEALRSSSSVRSLIYVTSDKCYKNKEWDWGYRESDELGGHDPYSASKAAAEIVFSSYASSFLNDKKQLGLASVRAGNVIGGGDWSDHRLVPDIVKSIESGNLFEIRNSSSIRPWQHVLEPLGGYLKLAAFLSQEPQKYFGPWNFGPSFDNFKTVSDLVIGIEKVFSESLSNKIEKRTAAPSSAPKETKVLKLNCDKAMSQLDWKPKWNFDQTVLETAKWYLEYFRGGDLESFTRKQIANFTGV